MTPKKLLIQIEAEADNEIGKARYEGALAMYECYQDKCRVYRETHADYYRKYQREYHRKWREERKKEVEAEK